MKRPPGSLLVPKAHKAATVVATPLTFAGPITTQLSRIYFDAVRGMSDRYKTWVTPIYST